MGFPGGSNTKNASGKKKAAKKPNDNEETKKRKRNAASSKGENSKKKKKESAKESGSNSRNDNQESPSIQFTDESNSSLDIDSLFLTDSSLQPCTNTATASSTSSVGTPLTSLPDPLSISENIQKDDSSFLMPPSSSEQMVEYIENCEMKHKLKAELDEKQEIRRNFSRLVEKEYEMKKKLREAEELVATLRDETIPSLSLEMNTLMETIIGNEPREKQVMSEMKRVEEMISKFEETDIYRGLFKSPIPEDINFSHVPTPSPYNPEGEVGSSVASHSKTNQSLPPLLSPSRLPPPPVSPMTIGVGGGTLAIPPEIAALQQTRMNILNHMQGIGQQQQQRFQQQFYPQHQRANNDSFLLDQATDPVTLALMQYNQSGYGATAPQHPFGNQQPMTFPMMNRDLNPDLQTMTDPISRIMHANSMMNPASLSLRLLNSQQYVQNPFGQGYGQIPGMAPVVGRSMNTPQGYGRTANFQPYVAPPAWNQQLHSIMYPADISNDGLAGSSFFTPTPLNMASSSRASQKKPTKSAAHSGFPSPPRATKTQQTSATKKSKTTAPKQQTKTTGNVSTDKAQEKIHQLIVKSRALNETKADAPKTTAGSSSVNQSPSTEGETPEKRNPSETSEEAHHTEQGAEENATTARPTQAPPSPDFFDAMDWQDEQS